MRPQFVLFISTDTQALCVLVPVLITNLGPTIYRTYSIKWPGVLIFQTVGARGERCLFEGGFYY